MVYGLFCRETLTCDHLATCENSRELPELKKNGKGGQNADNKSARSGKAGLQQASSRCTNARMPWGDTTARGLSEVPGATLDDHRLHAASVLFRKCGLSPPLFTRVVPVDASSHALAM